MKTRIVLFARLPAADEGQPPQIVFARWGETLELELPQQMGVEDFALKHNLKRLSKFDYAVGEMGRRATLLECHAQPTCSTLILDAGRSLTLTWENFRQTALALKNGEDRRFLQLAVQFLASGESIDDSVIAADYDAEFLQQLRTKLGGDSGDESR
ncbi:MAG: hypothetical protein FJY29_09295 [Betaproteobacteria bacterium]|nr:hypothetical protein [Betaproteobacteria bacterium]